MWTHRPLDQPSISITTPASGGSYVLNQAVASAYSCSDGGSGVASCSGPVANGAGIDTSSVGSKTFTVIATDNVGNASSQSAGYTVGYGVGSGAPADCIVYSQTKASNGGTTIPIKLELCSVSGDYLFSPGITLTVTGLTPTGTASGRGRSNPGGTFRFDASIAPGGGYVYNLDSTGLASGTYNLLFMVSGDPTTHQAQFMVR
jgi:hypothetical protein